MFKLNCKTGAICLLAATFLISACTNQEEINTTIRGQNYTIYHTYSSGESLQVLSVDSYTIVVDGKSLRCTSVDDCIFQAMQYLDNKTTPKPTLKPVEPTEGTTEETSFGD
jgi:hypothetical protein